MRLNAIPSTATNGRIRPQANPTVKFDADLTNVRLNSAAGEPFIHILRKSPAPAVADEKEEPAAYRVAHPRPRAPTVSQAPHRGAGPCLERPLRINTLFLTNGPDSDIWSR